MNPSNSGNRSLDEFERHLRRLQPDNIGLHSEELFYKAGWEAAMAMQPKVTQPSRLGRFNLPSVSRFSASIASGIAATILVGFGWWLLPVSKREHSPNLETPIVIVRPEPIREQDVRTSESFSSKIAQDASRSRGFPSTWGINSPQVLIGRSESSRYFQNRPNLVASQRNAASVSNAPGYLRTRDEWLKSF